MSKKKYFQMGIKVKDKPNTKLLGTVSGFTKTETGKIKPYKEEHYL